MKPPLHYAYIVAGVAFVLLIAAAGVRSSPTMLIQPLEKEFGWTPATISAAIAVNIGLFGLIGPFAAGIFERFGVRRTVAAALALLATGAALSSFMTQPWQFFLLWGLMAGVGTGSIGLVAGATIVNRWFEKNRGTAMGVLTAANATGQLVFLPLFGVLVTRSGWRTEVLFIAAVCAVLVPVTLLFVREHPSDMNLPMLGATEVAAPVRSGVNPFVNAIGALRSGLRSRDFWLLSGSFFICGASTNGLIGTHLVPACGDHGIPEVQAAGLLAAMGVFDLIGTTASGWLSDRYSSRWLLFWYYGLRGLSLIFLPTAFGVATLGLPLFAVFYGLDWIATVPPTLKLATSVFGRATGVTMFAWILAGHQLGAGVTAYLAGLARTWTSSYDVAFITSGMLCMIAALMVLFVGRAARVAKPLPA
ncbi:MAG: MFS transporter [Candidatus Eremiobacteraeota bacterium]|nr:MFS transporter [Candidatus Eremiobacteraeota bacterium]